MLSTQPPTALAQLSYGGEILLKQKVVRQQWKRGERHRRGGRRVKKIVTALERSNLTIVTICSLLNRTNEIPRDSFGLDPRCLGCSEIPALRAG